MSDTKNWWSWLIRKWSYHMPQPRTPTDFKWKAQDVPMLMLHGYAEVFFKSYSTQKTISSFSWHCPGKYCLCQLFEEVVHRSAQLNRTTMNPCHPHSSTGDWLSGTGSKLWWVSLSALGMAQPITAAIAQRKRNEVSCTDYHDLWLKKNGHCPVEIWVHRDHGEP